MEKTTKKDPELIRQWIAALRSGKYEQGTGRLRLGENEFCCWGVLYDIVNPRGWKMEGDLYWREDSEGAFKTMPTAETTESVGANKLVKGDGCNMEAWHHLINLNDGGVSFPEIADWIEKELLDEPPVR